MSIRDPHCADEETDLEKSKEFPKDGMSGLHCGTAALLMLPTSHSRVLVQVLAASLLIQHLAIVDPKPSCVRNEWMDGHSLSLTYCLTLPFK